MINTALIIVLHWTASGYSPNITDLNHYHYLITGQGRVIKGFHSIEDNFNCYDGNYAAHIDEGNTNTIGIAMCGMYEFKNREEVGKYPLTKKQVEKCFLLTSQLMKKYNIPLSNVTTHYHFGLKHPNTLNAGKIDIIYLPPYPAIRTNRILEFIQKKVYWYYLNKNDEL